MLRRWFVFIVLAFIALACKNPVVPENQAPTASFESGDFRVSGAGISGANGIYEQSGELNGSTYYSQVGGTYKIFINNYTDPVFPDSVGPYWAIDTDEATVSFYDLDYVMRDNDREFWLPEDGIWKRVAGTDPVAAVSGIPFTVGSDGGDQAGETVEVHYVFSDPDGDGEGNSEIRWYRCETPDALVSDSGSVEISSGSTVYTLQADDIGQNKYLKVQIIPFDDKGNEGLPVVSSAYMRVNQNS